LDAVKVTKSVTKANVNLGIILLIAPLAMVDASDEVQTLLDSLTPEDGHNVFEAIRLASPGGMKRDDVESDEDVELRPMGPIDLVAAMNHAADRDQIALQYATGFESFFRHVVTLVDKAMLQPLPAVEAVVDAHLSLMSEVTDTLIARKCGDEIANEAMARAANCLRNDSLMARQDLDTWLRADGNRRNPGTTADMIAAALYWLLSRGETQTR
jgi:triphosphoribosyl-dephospho-CoA synthase